MMMFDFHAEMVAEPQPAAAFLDPNREWCADCPATARTAIVAGWGVLEVVHEPTCPTLRAKTRGGAR